MKRVLVLVTLLVVLVGLTGFAQETDKPLFVKTISLLKVYTHQLGYKVLYLKRGAEIGEMYLPLSWFGQTTGKAQVIWGIGRELPYLSLYYKGDQFDHLRLYVMNSMLDSTWGVLQMSMEDAASQFKVDAPPLDF
jgi:hypothetical protein